VVAGFPDEEGNSVETVRALARRLPVHWLINSSPESVEWLLSGAERRDRIRLVPKDSKRAFLAYATARYVFFTHGLYGSPPAPRRRTFVNLWHGDGPKMSKRFANVRSTYTVAGTRLWGDQRPVYFGVAPTGVLVTGNPRIDQFARPVRDDQLHALGLDPAKPFILWMPTYRRTEYRGRRLAKVRNWADAADLSDSERVRHLIGEVSESASRLGVTVVVKPHPLDADDYGATDLLVIDGDVLNRAEVTVYQLLGRSHGLITDYSSVWTDYLAVDRPIGFYCPDLEQYEAARGLNVDGYRDLIPGPLLDSPADFEQFLCECLEESAASRSKRAQAAQRIGAVTRLGASDRLLDAVGIARG
jgi:CDP-glycerol glycerophosphotransferase (TagB/SpsB family)